MTSVHANHYRRSLKKADLPTKHTVAQSKQVIHRKVNFFSTIAPLVAPVWSEHTVFVEENCIKLTFVCFRIKSANNGCFPHKRTFLSPPVINVTKQNETEAEKQTQPSYQIESESENESERSLACNYLGPSSRKPAMVGNKKI